MRGVLTGSEITDMKIVLIGGRAHEKHTEGGDFRQAAYRAVRQGLMMAQMRLLEPVCSFRIDLPSDQIGRALSDLTQMSAKFESPSVDGASAVIAGSVPASSIGDYAVTLTSYTGGRGQMSTDLLGYFPCHNTEEVIEAAGYDPERDTANPSSSVFCSHGAGVLIPWDQVRSYMHVDTGWREGCIWSENGWRDGSGRALSDLDLSDNRTTSAADVKTRRRERKESELSFKEREKMRGAAEQELKEIFERTYGAVRDQGGKASSTLDRRADEEPLYDQSWRDYKKEAGRKRPALQAGQKHCRSGRTDGSGKGKRYLLVDGYNIIFAWDDLKELASRNIDSARDELIDRMSAYQGATGVTLILVFDAYRVRGRGRSVIRTGNISVVYTKEAETADAYIEKTVHEIADKNQVFVATSDGLEQTIILGEGATRISAREFRSMTEETREKVREQSRKQGDGGRALTRLLDHAGDDVMKAIKNENTEQ